MVFGARSIYDLLEERDTRGSTDIYLAADRAVLFPFPGD